MTAIQVTNERDQLAIEASQSDMARSGRRSAAVLSMAASVLTSKWPPETLFGETAAVVAAQQQQQQPSDSARSAVGVALAFALESVVRANELVAATTPAAVTFAQSAFDCADGKVPSVSVTQYIRRFIHYTPCSREVLVTAVAYVDRFLAHNSRGVHLSPLNVHRLFATAFVIASKFVSDLYYSNKFYAKVAGVGLSELNTLERIFLTELRYSLNLDPAQYAAYSDPVDFLAWVSTSFGDLTALVCTAVRELHIRATTTITEHQHQQQQPVVVFTVQPTPPSSSSATTTPTAPTPTEMMY
jgi:hypothetical protein